MNYLCVFSHFLCVIFAYIFAYIFFGASRAVGRGRYATQLASLGHARVAPWCDSGASGAQARHCFASLGRVAHKINNSCYARLCGFAILRPKRSEATRESDGSGRADRREAAGGAGADSATTRNAAARPKNDYQLSINH